MNDNATIPLLDHGFCRLVDFMGSDLAIVRAARVSYNAEWRSGEDGDADAKLIRYLMRNHHTSPFEHVVMTFDVKAPIFVFRQWHRHRTWSYNEISARYSELPEEFYVPEVDKIGKQSKSSKQARDLDMSADDAGLIRRSIRNQCGRAFSVYRELIAEGCPRELARGVLPVNTYSHMFATVDLHNLFHFCRLRLHEHAQYEVRVFADALLTHASVVAPVAVAAFLEAIHA